MGITMPRKMVFILQQAQVASTGIKSSHAHIQGTEDIKAFSSNTH